MNKLDTPQMTNGRPICKTRRDYKRLCTSHLLPLPPPPPDVDGRGIAGLMCGAVTFCAPRQCQVSAGLVILRKNTPVELTVTKSGAMTLCSAELLAGL